MARNKKLAPGLQIFRGSRPRQDVFASNAGQGCCDNSTRADYDKLAERTRFDNALAHLNPTGGNDKFVFPNGEGFEDTRNNVIRFINQNGEGAHFSVIAIPTYAFVTGVGIHIEAEEPGLTFDLVTRNGLELPAECVKVVKATVADGCQVTRDVEDGSAESYKGFGALGDASIVDMFFKAPACGNFSLEADELALKVASLPSSGKVTGQFRITVSVNYDVIHRAEM